MGIVKISASKQLDQQRGFFLAGVLNPTFFMGPHQGKNPTCDPFSADHLWAPTTDMEAALDNTCGPLQLCLDIEIETGKPSFDNLPTSLVTLIQSLSSDGDIDILWASYQSSPSYLEMTGLFFLSFGFIVIHVLINVLVAVFANVFASCREENEEKLERRRQGKTAVYATQVYALSLTLLLPDTYMIGVLRGLKLHRSIAVLLGPLLSFL